MECLNSVCNDAKEKLGRDLVEEEKNFLRWMLHRHHKETIKERHMQVPST